MSAYYDAAADFKINNNPNGPWQYGYTVAIAGNIALIKFDNNAQSDAWTKSGYFSSGTPAAWVNKSTLYGVPAGRLWLHPGPRPNGDYAVLRFTAPQSGSYRIDGGFGSGDSGQTDGTVAINGQYSPPARYFTECTNTSTFSIGPVPLQSGQTVDFLVGNKGNFGGDSTPVSAVIRLLDGANDINTYVASLGRLPPVITTSAGQESGTENVAAEITVQANAGYSVVEQRRMSVTAVTENSYMNDTAMEGVWPGQVLQGAPLLGSDPAAIGPFVRRPGTITISSAATVSNPGPMFARVEEVNGARVSQARIDLLNARNPTDANGILKGSFMKASTLREVGVKANVSIKGSNFGADANMALNTSFSNTTVVAVLRQNFYTVTFAPDAAGADGFWAPSVGVQDLARYMGPGNPPLWVESVTYGRLIVVCGTASFSSSDFSAALAANFSSGNVSGTVGGSVSIKDVIESANISIYTIGVPGHVNFERITDINGLGQVYSQGKVFNKENIGAPIGFTCRHVADNTLARFSLVAEYMETLRAESSDVRNAMFNVWDGPGGGQVNTGIRVNPGDDVTIEAAGQTWGGTFFGLIGPEGWRGSKGESSYPAPDLPKYGLIARFGMGPWVYAAKFWSGKPPKSQGGILQLNLNDDNPYNGGADRKLTIKVTVIRGNAAAAGVYI